jgi:hypothetical protein
VWKPVLNSALGLWPTSSLNAKPRALNSHTKCCARSVAHQLAHQPDDSDEGEEEEEEEEYDDADNGNIEVNTLNLKIDGIHEVDTFP